MLSVLMPMASAIAPASELRVPGIRGSGRPRLSGVAKLVCQGWRGREDHFYFARFRRRAVGNTTLTAPQPISEADVHALLEALNAQ